MKTKIFSLLLAVAASIGTMHAAIINGTCGENLTWSLNTRDSTLTIEGSGMMTGTSWSWWDGSNTPWSSYCSYIKYASLPNGLTSIGAGAFSGCGELASVTIPSSVTSIGDGAFSECSGLTSITIPNSVTRIGGLAFAWCHGLTSINIPESVTSVGDYVFGECINLTSLTVGYNLTNLGNWHFGDCNINTIHFDGSLEQWCTKSWNPCDVIVFYRTPTYTLYIGEELISNAVIPNNVTTIGNNAFSRCSSLTSVIIPDGVTSIGSAAFSDCNNVTSIEIPNSVTSIGGSAFSGCSRLNSVNIPNNITTVAASLFSGCNALTSINIPNSVTSIGDNAFQNCSLSTITCEAITPPSMGTTPFSNYSAILFVPEESIEAYQNALYWEEFADIRAIGSAPLVQFVDWNGTVLSSANVTIGTAATPPANPTRTGYTFIGWDKDFSNITEDLVVTAQYQINRYLVQFLDWDDSVLKADSVDYNSAAIAPANPSREGHEFISWDKDFSHVVSDMTITAQYAVNFYPVGFLNYDGTLLSEQSIAYNQAAMEPNVPTREGYTFIGWTADITHITARTFAIALYEKQNLLLVTYKKEDGEVISSENVDLHLPEAPEIEGFSFLGWRPVANLIEQNAIVIEAVYEANASTSAPAVYTNPANPAQKLIRNGNVYILTGDKTYTIDGRLVR